MGYVSSSEDEFPDIEVIARGHKQKPASKQLDKEAMSGQPSSPKSAQTIFNEVVGKTPATARRVRKLGRGQPMDGSLLKPWQGSEGERGIGSRAPNLRQPSKARDGRTDIGAISAGELLDRLPMKAKHTGSRAVSGSTVFDSPPKEQKKTRRLITRGEKKALSAKIVRREEDWATSSDKSGSDNEDYGKNDIALPVEDEESDFIFGGDSDSDELSMTPPQRSQSPSGPRRMQRRVLSSSRDPIKKELMQAKSTRDNTITSPKKQPEKRDAPKASITRQLKSAPKGNLEDVFEKLKMCVFLLGTRSCGRSY